MNSSQTDTEFEDYEQTSFARRQIWVICVVLLAFTAFTGAALQKLRPLPNSRTIDLDGPSSFVWSVGAGIGLVAELPAKLLWSTPSRRARAADG